MYRKIGWRATDINWMEYELSIRKRWMDSAGINGADDRRWPDSAFCGSSEHAKQYLQEGTQQSHFYAI